MYFLLFLTFDGIKFDSYGPYVDDLYNNPKVVCYSLDEIDVKLILKDIDQIDNKCNALLDYGDVDFFDAEKCLILKEWTIERLQKPTTPRYREILETLVNYCERAIKLKTGVTIEL